MTSETNWRQKDKGNGITQVAWTETGCSPRGASSLCFSTTRSRVNTYNSTDTTMPSAGWVAKQWGTLETSELNRPQGKCTTVLRSKL